MRSVDPRDARQSWEQSARQEASYVEKALGLVLLLVLAIGCILVLKPFLTAILLAVILSVSTWQLLRRIEHWLGGRQTPAALLMTLLTAGLLVLPLLDLVATEIAVIGFPDGCATLLETMDGVTVEEIVAATKADLALAPELAQIGGAKSVLESVPTSALGETV